MSDPIRPKLGPDELPEPDVKLLWSREGTEPAEADWVQRMLEQRVRDRRARERESPSHYDPKPTACPHCCASIIQTGLADAGRVCPGCEREAYTR